MTWDDDDDDDDDVDDNDDDYLHFTDEETMAQIV